MARTHTPYQSSLTTARYLNFLFVFPLLHFLIPKDFIFFLKYLLCLRIRCLLYFIQLL